MIELQNVEKVYEMDDHEIKVLNGIDLKISDAESVAIVGPSGSGKSTMLHLMGCLDKPTGGKILIDGRDVSKLSDSELARIRNSKIGFVFQFFNLISSFDAERNVMLPMSLAGISRKEQREKARELLSMVGMSHRLHHMPSKLSGGERQKVAIARAMANRPEIILADEPTGNLDTKTGKEIIEMLLDLNKKYGTTLVIITHDLSVASHAKRMVYIRDGRIIKDTKRSRC